MNSNTNNHNSNHNLLSTSSIGLPLYGGSGLPPTNNLNSSHNFPNGFSGQGGGLNSSTSFMHGFLSNLNQSQVINHHQLNVSQSITYLDKARYEAEILDLKKDLRRKDTENEKQKAILQQKVELLELQLKEAQEREENTKKIHETLMSALQNDSASTFKTPRGFEISQATHRRQMSELRIDYETQIKDLKQLVATKDANLKDTQIQMESLQIDHQRKVQELELDKRDLENKIKKVELEKQQYALQIDSQNSQQSQLQDYKDLIEEKTNEMEKERIQYENQINEIQQERKRQQNESDEEIQRLKNKVSQMENEIQQRYQNQLKIQSDKYLKEVEEIQNQMFDQQKRQRDEISQIIRERDEMNERAQKIEKQLDKLKNAPRPVTVQLAEEDFGSNSRKHLHKNQRLEEENDYLNTQVNKMTLQIRELRDDVTNYQQNERHLKKEISQRLDEIDQLRIDYQKRLNEERRKFALQEDEFAALKLDYDRKKNEFASILNDKDTTIADLKRDVEGIMLEQTKFINMNSMMIPQSPIAQKDQSMNASRDFQMGINKMINARSLSPNMSNFIENNQIKGPSSNNAVNMFIKNQSLK